MNITKKILWIFGVAVIAVGCTTNEPTDAPVNNPTEEYVRLSLYGGCGHNAASNDVEISRVVWEDKPSGGDMTLKWDGSETLSLVLSDGEKPIMGRSSSVADEVYTESSHSKLSVVTYENDSYHAEFQSQYYYSTDDLAGAKYCYVVAGNTLITSDEEQCCHVCSMDMPSTFAQSSSSDLGFLRNYMYIYSTVTYKEHRTNLDFHHVPATIRFVITNSKSEAMLLQEASVGVAEGGVVASKSANLSFGWCDGKTDLQFDNDGYEKVAVNMGAGASVASGAVYTAYATVLPLSSKSTFSGKTLNFCVKIDGQEIVALELAGAKMADINGSSICNWVSGNSYTVKINIREDGKATGEITADNRIEVVPKTPGIYTLVYEGEDGVPLAGYAEICTLTVKELAYYEDFIDVNIAPREAKVIGIYDSAGERQGSIALADFKPDFTKKALYSFGLLSDVHIGRSEINPETDFERALNFFNAKGVAHTCICGDITQNGKEAEYQSWRGVAELSDAPIYTVAGNHDATSGGIVPDVWTNYTDLPLVFERSVASGGNTDHFLFLGMDRWNFSAAYLDYHLVWLERKLEEYRNERCFVVTHLFFPERAGNMNNIYPSGNWLKGEQLEKLLSLCDRYVNSIWFSGHSHWEWQLQKYQDRANIYRGYNALLQPTSGWCVHVPSCGVPITSDGSTRVDNKEGSEGAVIEVYENHIDILGVDFSSGKYLPIATYRLDTALQEVAKSNATLQNYYLSASNFTVNPKKKGATVKDVEGMANYVEVTFTEKSQGFYVVSDTFTSSITKASITIEDVQAFSNGVAIDIPAGVGFYGSSGYYLVSTNKAEVKPETYEGVQFQTSGSKYGDGPLPLTLRMKCQMKFYEQ